MTGQVTVQKEPPSIKIILRITKYNDLGNHSFKLKKEKRASRKERESQPIRRHVLGSLTNQNPRGRLLTVDSIRLAV